MNRWISPGILALFVVLASANGLLFGVAHDEGVSVDIAVGNIDWALVSDFQPVPVSDLYPFLDGSNPRSSAEVLAQLSKPVNPHPPAYFLGLNLWTRLFGVGRLALRLPGLICGLAALVGLALLMGRLTPRPTAGLWVMALAALSPWFTALTTFARPYALALALAVWSTICVVDLARGRSLSLRRAQFVILSVLGIYTLYHYAFVIVWQFCFLAAVAWRQHPGSRWRQGMPIAVMAAIIAACFAPWLPTLLQHFAVTGDTPSYYKGPVDADTVMGSSKLLLTFLLGDSIPRQFAGVFNTLLTGLGALTLASLVVVLARRKSVPAGERTTRTLLWTAPLYPGAILLADLLHGTRTITVSKTCLLLFPMLIVAIVLACELLSRRRLRQALLSCWALLFACASVTSAYGRTLWVDHHAAVAKTLAATDTASHRVLLNSLIRGHAIPLLLTLEQSAVENVELVYAPPMELKTVLARTLADPRSQLVTMINLHALYAWDDTLLWSPEQIDASARMARQAGWEVARTPPNVVARRVESPAKGRRFEIINPVW